MKLIPLGGLYRRDQAFVKVDDEDYDNLSRFYWYIDSKGYPVRFGGVRMHRHILGKAGKLVDHRNHDKLDSQRSNLRLCNNFQNQQNRGKNRNNTSGYKGVSYQQTNRNYRATITANGKQKWLGAAEDPHH